MPSYTTRTAPPSPLVLQMAHACTLKATKLGHELRRWNDPKWTKFEARSSFCDRCWAMTWVRVLPKGGVEAGGQAITLPCGQKEIP